MRKQNEYGRDGQKSQWFYGIPDSMIVQIYEIQSPEEAQLMVDLGVDHVGTVVLSPEQRQDHRLKQTIETVQRSGRKSSVIPLFHEVDLVIELLSFLRPDIVHFCETLSLNGPNAAGTQEALERQKIIRNAFPDIQIMRSIPIATTGFQDRVPSLRLAELFEPVSDWFLTDTLLTEDERASDREQPVNGFVGITGKTCDWGTARKLVESSRIPVILAGGLGPDNTREGIEIVGPSGVDSCTQTNEVDTNGQPIRFKKNPDKVRRMIEAAQMAG